jgi:hypothetical protein
MCAERPGGPVTAIIPILRDVDDAIDNWEEIDIG